MTSIVGRIHDELKELDAAGLVAASLAGRCANGYERDQGTKVHALPYSKTLVQNADYTSRALCGAKPGARSAGWSCWGIRLVNCSRCLSVAKKRAQG
jgi:hypothetical protein